MPTRRKSPARGKVEEDAVGRTPHTCLDGHGAMPNLMNIV